jgi:putative oxidoreductase
MPIFIIRLMVGAVFLSEGLQKFITPDKTGVGRFTKIGLPNPEILGPFVGGFEILCGTLVLVGLFTRFAVIPLIVIMITALATTKYPILMEEGFWAVAHAMRTDWSMLLGSIFLLITGAGTFSVDERLSPRTR